MDTNYWLTDECARAFWDQHLAQPYQELLADTLAWLDPKPGEQWLDLGCGGGQLTAALWRAAEGKLARIVALDCAAANGEAISRLIRRLPAPPGPGQVVFHLADFSRGIPDLPPSSFDGIVSGLALSYAEHQDPQTGRYTDHAYNQIFRECRRVLKPTGRLVFSVNVPEPNFWRIVWKSLGTGLKIRRPLRTLRNVWRMQQYGKWLKREARRGRFHFLPQEAVIARLRAAGFGEIKCRLSYAGQAYLFCAQPATAAVAAA